MFYISIIEHDIILRPQLLTRPIIDALEGEIEKLFLDKVIKNLGLCISVYDIQSIEDGFVLPGEGYSSYKVVFRLIMFKPFIGEVIVGKIESSDENGLQVSLGFFNDIRIPKHLLKKPCIRKDEKWVWVYGEDEDNQFPIEETEEIRFRVTNVKFPPFPLVQSEDKKPFSPMEIIGSIDLDGLGLVSWW